MDYIENLILWTFFLYGVYEFSRIIIYDLLKNRKNKYLIVAVKDGEDYIEGLLRSEILKNKYSNGEYISKILVIDLNSEDNTKNIIEDLEMKNGYIKLVDWEELRSILNV